MVNKAKWEERRPIEGETVKVDFASWTKLGTKIGVFLRFHSGRAIVDFGSRLMYLDEYSPFFCLDK